MKAYYALSFEREAYAMQDDLNYKYKRKRFAWLKMMRWNKEKLQENQKKGLVLVLKMC